MGCTAVPALLAGRCLLMGRPDPEYPLTLVLLACIAVISLAYLAMGACG